MNRDKPADVVFVLDATSSMQMVLTAMIKYIHNVHEELEFNFQRALFYYGAVIYRDPITYKPSPPSTPADPNDMLEFEKQKIRDLKEKNLYNEEEEAMKKERKKHFDHIKYPENINVAIDLVSDFKKLKNELRKVDCGSGNDDEEDWVGALDLALNVISWRNESKKLIVWVSDSNAHGFKYSGKTDHQEEEAKLDALTKKMAESNIYFRGINVKKNDNGCNKTLLEMQKIYNENGGKSFVIEELPFQKDVNLDDYDVSPGFFNDFRQTILKTIRRAYPGEIFE